MFKSKYNDIDLVYDKNIYEKLRSNDIDDQLAKHVSHLFIRDPLVIFKELLDQDDSVSSDHFEVCHCAMKNLTANNFPNYLDIEHPIYQLADIEIQASTAKLQHWMAS